MLRTDIKYPFPTRNGIIWRKKCADSIRSIMQKNPLLQVPVRNEHRGQIVGQATNFRYIHPVLLADLNFDVSEDINALIEETGYDVSPTYSIKKETDDMQIIKDIFDISLVFGRGRCPQPLCGINPHSDELKLTMTEEKKEKEEKEEKKEEKEEEPKSSDEKKDPPKKEEKKEDKPEPKTSTDRFNLHLVDALEKIVARLDKMEDSFQTSQQTAASLGLPQKRGVIPAEDGPKIKMDGFNWKKTETGWGSLLPGQTVEKPTDESIEELGDHFDYYGGKK